MHRHALTDKQWEWLQELVPKLRRGPASKLGDRLFIDAVLYRARTGCPWRDLPERLGPWKSVYNRFYNWSDRGAWKQIFDEVDGDLDETGCIVGASVVRAHQDVLGGKGGSNAILWAVLEEVFQPSSLPSSTRQRALSTSR